MADIVGGPPGPEAPNTKTPSVAELSPARVTEQERLRVFISYSRRDHEFADQLLAALETCGFECIIDREDISAGEDWKRRLGALIADADTVVFVVSAESSTSQTCQWEVDKASELGKRIFPVVYDVSRPLTPPPLLEALNQIFFCPDPGVPGSGFGRGLKSLAGALNTDFSWLRKHTRYLERAMEWAEAGRDVDRLLTGRDIADAKAWITARPKSAPAPTPLQLDFIRASEAEAEARSNAEVQRLKEMAEAADERAAALRDKEDALRDKEAALLTAQQEQERRARIQVVRNVLLIVSVVAALGAVFLALSVRNQREHAEALLTAAKPIVAGAQYRMDETGRESAFRFFEEAAGFGDASSLGYVGVSYRNGWGVPRDYPVAIKSLSEAAERGDTNAMDNLGSIYDSGEAAKQGFAQDFALAREWYEKAATAGNPNPNSMVNLGRLYGEGKGVPKDQAAALQWYERAAAKGQAEAMFDIGAFYDSGEGLGADPVKAREWYAKAAEKGHAGAMVRLGGFYEAGRGAPQDFGQAVGWYERAATHDDPQAMFRLGALTQAGRGVPQDTAEAIFWFERAGEAGQLDAMQSLGAIYENGAAITPNPAKAREWRERAAGKTESHAEIAPPKGGAQQE